MSSKLIQIEPTIQQEEYIYNDMLISGAEREKERES